MKHRDIDGAFLFVYGTLMKGFPMNDKFGGTYVDKAFIIGARLWNLGLYPGLKMTGHPNDVAYGELYFLSDPEKSFAILDQYEGPMYERVTSQCYSYDLGKGLNMLYEPKAYVYKYLGETKHSGLVPFGKWRRKYG